jgi:hypothetical protein
MASQRHFVVWENERRRKITPAVEVWDIPCAPKDFQIFHHESEDLNQIFTMDFLFN